MEKGEFELAQILLFPILKLVLSQPLQSETVINNVITVFLILYSFSIENTNLSKSVSKP